MILKGFSEAGITFEHRMHRFLKNVTINQILGNEEIR